MLIGALIAASQSKVISINTSGFDFGEQMDEKNTRENVMLIQGEPMQMGNYKVTYLSDSLNGPNTYFRVNYQRIDEQTGKVKEEFDLYPERKSDVKGKRVSVGVDLGGWRIMKKK